MQAIEQVDCRDVNPLRGVAEEMCYVEHRFNHHLVPIAQKYNILGMPVPIEYGGRGADTVTYAKALARIGQEGTGVRTFFSGHTSLGQYPIMTWGSEDLKRRYLPPSCKGEKILAFGLTEPDAGSNPLEMTSTYEKQGDNYVLNGTKYLISNAGIASSVVVFAYPKTGGRISAFVIDTDRPGINREDLLAKVGMPTARQFELTDYDAAHQPARPRRTVASRWAPVSADSASRRGVSALLKTA